MTAIVPTWIAAPLLALAMLPVTAAPADISLRDSAAFSDVGHDAFERNRNLTVLRLHLEALAQRLPSHQTLRVELLDVDLAGEIKTLPQGPVRVLDRSAASPHIHLRFELRQGDQIVIAGEARLGDPGYLMRLGNRFEREALPYERRMLDQWFQETFARQLVSLR